MNRKSLTLLLCLCSPAALACTVSATGLSFGAINPLSDSSTTAVGTITVTCSSSTSFTASLSPGSGSYSQRAMLAGSNNLDYQIYLDSARTMPWGDGSGSTSTWSGTASTSAASHSVYGLVPAQNKAFPGSYSDTITVTVKY